MDPLTLVATLSTLVPDVLHLFGHDTAANTAQKVADIAKQVTGTATPDAALAAIQADPNVALNFKKAIIDQKVQLEQLAMQKAKNDEDADTAATAALTDRISALEGTASDLKALPVLGNVMLFARGAQRPLIGYGVMWLDYMVFSGAFKTGESGGMLSNLFFMINLLVLAFLFGERAVKNLAPLITDMIAAKVGGKA